MGYEKNRIAYTLTSITQATVIGDSASVTAANGLVLPANVPVQFNIMHGYDTRMPVYGIQTSGGAATLTIRAEYQEDVADNWPGVAAGAS